MAFLNIEMDIVTINYLVTKYQTNYEYFILLTAFILYEAGILGITAGAHRLWSHRAYKAKWPLRLILMLFHTLAFQVHDFIYIHDDTMTLSKHYHRVEQIIMTFFNIILEFSKVVFHKSESTSIIPC
jgi:fatty-acid desaturase